jgi:hypothetical protein
MTGMGDERFEEDGNRKRMKRSKFEEGRTTSRIHNAEYDGIVDDGGPTCLDE